jgi:hypothetical protein
MSRSCLRGRSRINFKYAAHEFGPDFACGLLSHPPAISEKRTGVDFDNGRDVRDLDGFVRRRGDKAFGSGGGITIYGWSADGKRIVY